MLYVLILLTAGQPTTADFYSAAACQEAARVVLAQSRGRDRVRAVCAPKGEALPVAFIRPSGGRT